jgi:hypothetical protein
MKVKGKAEKCKRKSGVTATVAADKQGLPVSSDGWPFAALRQAPGNPRQGVAPCFTFALKR